MNNFARHSQRGYLFEIPILLVLVIIVVSSIFPRLPPWGQKVLIGIAAIPILFALFYMIVIPGWTPNSEGRLKWPWNWVVFLLVAIPVVAVVVLIILG